jgi:hypothetical protein
MSSPSTAIEHAPLTLEDLDIEELDRRLALSPIATAAAWCQVNCGDLSRCVPNCDTDCSLVAQP